MRLHQAVATLVWLLPTAAAGQEGSWLDIPEQDAPDEQPDEQPDEAPPARGTDRTFGTELTLFGIKTTWSGYGDMVLAYVPGETLSFDATHFNPILGARLGPTLWAELELEFEHAGEEILVEYGILDWTPRREIGLRLGQFLVPIGRFNEILHPSFRWPQISRPAMFRDVVPAVWSDVGVQLRGSTGGPAGEWAYAAYVCNGLGGSFHPRADEPIRALRHNVEDVDIDLGVGGQGSWRLARGASELELVASGYTGKIDPTTPLRLTLADLALSARQGPVFLRAEAARAFLGAEDEALDPYQEGLYGQLGLRVGRVTPSVRHDLVRTDLDREAVLSQSVSGTVMVEVATFWSVRGEVTIPIETQPTPTLMAMSAFFF